MARWVSWSTRQFTTSNLSYSEKNISDRRRWAYLIAYNRRDNSPVYEHFLPGYTPLHKVGSLSISSEQSNHQSTLKNCGIKTTGTIGDSYIYSSFFGESDCKTQR